VSFDIEELTKAITLHGRVARVVIVDVKGSTPREIGASMLVWDGGQSGTIGGGALEFEAAKRALNVSQIETVSLGPNLGQCCGGSVVLATEIFEAIPEVHDHYTRVMSVAPLSMYLSRCQTLKLLGSIRHVNGFRLPSLSPSMFCLLKTLH